MNPAALKPSPYGRILCQLVTVEVKENGDAQKPESKFTKI